MIRVTQAKSVIHQHNKAFPVMHDLNPYRGCTIGCRYCFAQYSHHYVGLENFFRDIIVKENAGVCLDNELSKKHKRFQVKIGGVTDAYQPLEKKFGLMPEILSVFERHRFPIFISTKSDLILRDLELIKRLAEVTAVDIAVSISCFDEANAKIIEPGAATPQKRIDALSQFTDFARSTSILNMPIIPFISDSPAELENLFAASRKARIGNMVSYPLSLRSSQVKQKFFKLVKRNFPMIYNDFENMFMRSSSPDPGYVKGLMQTIGSLREKYELFDNYSQLEPEIVDEQLSLF